VAFLRGVSASPSPQSTASTIGEVTTLKTTLGYKPAVTLLVDVIQNNTVVVLKPSTVSISPAAFALTTQGQTQQLQATVKDQFGAIFLGAGVTWSINDSRISISGSGLVTAIGTGATATVTVTVAGNLATGTSTVTTPATVPTTLTINAGFSTLAASALAAGFKFGVSVNPGYEAHPNYQQNWAQQAGAGGVTTSENLWNPTHLAPTATLTGAVWTINWNFPPLDAQVVKAQLQGTVFKSYMLPGVIGITMNPRGNWVSGTSYAANDGAYDTTTSPGRWYVCRIAVSSALPPSSDFTTFTPGGLANQPTHHWRQQTYSPDYLNQYVVDTASCTSFLNAYIDGITQHYNTPGSPTAWSSVTAYVAGNTVSRTGHNYTAVSASTNVDPAVASAAWLRTEGLYMHNVCNEAIFGALQPSPWAVFIGTAQTFIPLMCRRTFLGDPGAKLQFNNDHYGWDGSANGSASQNTLALAILSAIIAGGSVGGAANIVLGVEAHIICSLMQITNGPITGFHGPNFTAFLNSVTALGCGWSITELDCTDNMFEGSGAAGAVLGGPRDVAIGTAYANYLAAVKAATAKPDHVIEWQLSDKENWLDVNSINLRSDGLPQRPDLLDLNYAQKISWATFVSFLGSYSGGTISLALNDALPHQIPATLLDQWGAGMSLSNLAWSSSNATHIPVTSGGVVQANQGSQSATITASAPGTALTQTATVTTLAPVLTSVSLAPGDATLSSGTLQETATESDQYGVALAGIGGGVAVFTASTGVGLSANIPAIAAASAQIWEKGRILVDGLRALAVNTGAGLTAIDSDGAGTNKKFEAYAQVNASGQVQIDVAAYIAASVRSTVLGAPFVNLTAFPANGQYVEWFAGVDVTNNATACGFYDPNGNVINDGAHSSQGAGHFVPTVTSGVITTSGITGIGATSIALKGTGLAGTVTIGSTFTISATLYTATAAAVASGQVVVVPVSPVAAATYAAGTAVTGLAGAPLNTTGGANGRVRINHGLNAIAVSQALTHDGAGVYVGPIPAVASQWSIPAVGDANIQAAWIMGDATSGALTTAAALVGGQVLTYTAAVGGFSDPNGWSAPAGPSYTWASDNPGAVTAASGPGAGQGTVTFVAVGSAHVTATPTAAPTVSGTALITAGAPGVPTTITVVPTAATLVGVGATAQVTPTVTDQFGNVIAVPVTYSTANAAVATVNAGGLITWAAPGTTTITTAVTGVVPILSAATVVTATAAAATNEPLGATPQINTGVMTAVPAGLVMLSPTPWGAPFQTGDAANLTVVPTAQGTGLRLTYPSILPAGFSPVRFSFAIPTPASEVYIRMRVRYSANWTNNGNAGTGLFAPQFANNNNAGNENDLVVGRCDNPPAVDQYVTVLQQGQATRQIPVPSGVPPTYANANPSGNMAGPSRNTWHTMEWLFTPQTTTSSANGGCTVWMDGVQCVNQQNVVWVGAADSQNWASLLFDPTYGAVGGVSPPAGPSIAWDFDQLYVSTVGGGAHGAHEPVGMTTVFNTGAIASFAGSGLIMIGGTQPTSPGTGTGLVVTYLTSLVGGNSPGQFGTGNFSSFGIGTLYVTYLSQTSAGFTVSTNTDVKSFEPHTQQQGSGGGQENHILAMWNEIGPTSLSPLVGLQGPTNSTNIHSSVPHPNVTDGAQHLIEWLLVQETPAGSGTGSAQCWVDGVLCINKALIPPNTWLGVGNARGWVALVCDPTYGGGTASPPSTMTWTFDKLYCSVK
jgi:Glycosyl hydrolase family 10